MVHGFSFCAVYSYTWSLLLKLWSNNHVSTLVLISNLCVILACEEPGMRKIRELFEVCCFKILIRKVYVCFHELYNLFLLYNARVGWRDMDLKECQPVMVHHYHIEVLVLLVRGMLLGRSVWIFTLLNPWINLWCLKVVFDVWTVASALIPVYFHMLFVVK